MHLSNFIHNIRTHFLSKLQTVFFHQNFKPHLSLSRNRLNNMGKSYIHCARKLIGRNCKKCTYVLSFCFCNTASLKKSVRLFFIKVRIGSCQFVKKYSILVIFLFVFCIECVTGGRRELQSLLVYPNFVSGVPWDNVFFLTAIIIS